MKPVSTTNWLSDNSKKMNVKVFYVGGTPSNPSMIITITYKKDGQVIHKNEPMTITTGNGTITGTIDISKIEEKLSESYSIKGSMSLKIITDIDTSDDINIDLGDPFDDYKTPPMRQIKEYMIYKNNEGWVANVRAFKELWHTTNALVTTDDSLGIKMEINNGNFYPNVGNPELIKEASLAELSGEPMSELSKKNGTVYLVTDAPVSTKVAILIANPNRVIVERHSFLDFYTPTITDDKGYPHYITPEVPVRKPKEKLDFEIVIPKIQSVHFQDEINAMEDERFQIIIPRDIWSISTLSRKGNRIEQIGSAPYKYQVIDQE